MEKINDFTKSFTACVQDLGTRGMMLAIGATIGCGSSLVPADDRALWEKRKFLTDCLMLTVVNLGVDLEGMGREGLSEELEHDAERFYELTREFRMSGTSSSERE